MGSTRTNYIWQVHSLDPRYGARRVTFYRRKSWGRTYLPTPASWERLKKAICGRSSYKSLDGASIRFFPVRP